MGALLVPVALSAQKPAIKRPVRAVRSHHARVVQLNGPHWKRYLQSCNHLRVNRWLALRQADAKHRLDSRFPNDRDAYTNGTTGFVEAVLAMPMPAGRAAGISAPAGLLAA